MAWDAWNFDRYDNPNDARFVLLPTGANLVPLPGGR
jgi:hypothetical protein